MVAVFTRRTVEPLLLGALFGFGLVSQSGFFGEFIGSLLKVMGDGDVVWIVLVCGLFGALIRVLVLSGAAEALGDAMASVVRGRRGVLLGTWLLGILVFVDDYLNALTVGATMRRLADRFGISRAMLAYVVDSTAAPVCVLVPMSTWALYVSGLLEENGVAEAGAGLTTYVGVAPLVIYAWVAMGVVLLVALGLIPAIGPMQSEERLTSESREQEPELDESSSAQTGWLKALTFVVPIALLVGATLWMGGDDDTRVLKAILFAIAAAIPLAWFSSERSLPELLDGALEGIGRMIPALAIIVLSFVLKDVNDRLGLTPYVIDTFGPLMTKSLLPAVVFVAISLVTFSTGSFWGTFAITLPIVVPLAQELRVSIPLAVGAVISAGAFGSHACFYGDATVLSSTACGVNNMTHAVTQAPYAVASAVLTVMIYLLLGVVL